MRTLKEITKDLLAQWEKTLVEPTREDLEERRRQTQIEACGARQRELEGRGISRRAAEAIAWNGVADTPAMLAARGWWAQQDRCLLVLSGHRGCGKTVAASWLVAQEPNAEFLPVTGLARVGLYNEQRFSQLSSWRLLAIDDLGMEFVDQRGAFLSLFDALIDTRYARDLRTVVTTNLPSDDFVARYGERIADRIREAGMFVETDSPSLRSRV